LFNIYLIAARPTRCHRSATVTYTHTDPFAFARVRVGRDLYGRVETDADLLQEVASELVAVDQLDDARVQVKLDAYVEVVGAIEQILVRMRLGHAVTIEDRTCNTRVSE